MKGRNEIFNLCNAENLIPASLYPFTICLWTFLMLSLWLTPITCYADRSVDIKANDLDGPVVLSENNALTLSISQTLDEEDNASGDYWIIAETPAGFYYYNVFTGWWGTGIEAAYQGTLISFPMTPFFSTSSLTGVSPGQYIF